MTHAVEHRRPGTALCHSCGRNIPGAAIVLLGGLLTASLLATVSAAGAADAVVVTTSMLESAVHDAAGPGHGIRVVRLIQPGGCPGHFDLSPRALPALRQARCIIRHDFQADLDRKIAHLGADGLDSVVVKADASLLIPNHYQGLVAAVRRILVAHGLSTSPDGAETDAVDEALTRQIAELEALAAEHRSRYGGRRVMASLHQKAFCEWLGYDVTGVLKRAENTTPADFRELMQSSADLVIANLQSDGTTGRSVAGRKGIPLAIISNFPGTDDAGQGFAELFKSNLRRIEAAWQE